MRTRARRRGGPRRRGRRRDEKAKRTIDAARRNQQPASRSAICLLLVRLLLLRRLLLQLLLLILLTSRRAQRTTTSFHLCHPLTVIVNQPTKGASTVRSIRWIGYLKSMINGGEASSRHQPTCSNSGNYREEKIDIHNSLADSLNAIQQQSSLPSVQSSSSTAPSSQILTTSNSMASGLYQSQIVPAICRGTTKAPATSGGSPHHRLPSPLFHGSIMHHGNSPAAPALLTTQMTLSHYGSGLRAMSAFGSIGSTTSNLTSNLRRYHCKLCPAMFDSKAELQIHTQVHMREAKPYKCSHCPKSFANSSYLSQHMRIHLGLKPFGPCQYCGRKFTQLSHLQQHLRTHTGEKPYKCRYPGCEKAFSQLSNLQSHSRCHQTDKPYKCNSCYKCFCDEQSLLDHIPKHKESKHLKVHICPYCGKSYTQAAYLAKHMTKHADKKPMKPVASAEQHLWVRENSLCAVPSILDGCGDQTASSALPFNSFPAHNHMMQPQTCAYTPTGIASSMAAAGMTPDPSAFTRLAGLNPLSRSFAAASSRSPYFAYENFKSPAHANALSHPSYNAPYNHLIRLDDIRNYAGQAAAAASAEHLSMLVKRDPREAVYN